MNPLDRNLNPISQSQETQANEQSNNDLDEQGSALPQQMNITNIAAAGTSQPVTLSSLLQTSPTLVEQGQAAAPLVDKISMLELLKEKQIKIAEDLIDSISVPEFDAILDNGNLSLNNRRKLNGYLYP